MFALILFLGSGLFCGLGSALGDEIAKDNNDDRKRGRLTGALVFGLTPNLIYAALQLYEHSQGRGTIAASWAVHLLAVAGTAVVGSRAPDADTATPANLVMTPVGCYCGFGILSFFALLNLTLL